MSHPNRATGDLRAEASAEAGASATVRQLLADRAARARTELAAFRQAISAAAETYQQALAAAADDDQNGAIVALVGRVAASSAQEVTRARAELESATAESARLAAALQQAREQQQASHRQYESAAAESTRLASSAQQAQDQLQDAREQLQESQRQHDALSTQLVASTARVQELESIVATLEGTIATLESTVAENAALSAMLDESRQKLGATDEARQGLAADLAQSAARIQSLEAGIVEQGALSAALEQSRQQLEASERKRETLADDLAACVARIHVLESAAANNRAFVDHLPSIFRSVAGARTIPDALTAVANGLTCFFSRVAIFRVRPSRLEGVYQTGFDFTGDISNVIVPLTMDSMLAEAVSSERVKLLAKDDLADQAIPFGGEATCALVLPVSIEQKTVAVVYADDSRRPSGENVSADERGAFAQLIHDYVSSHIDRIVSSQRTLAELDAYAKMLLDEVERLYLEDVAAGKDTVHLILRLRENLHTARQIFAVRVELESPGAASLLEDRVAAITQVSPPTPFGRDLLEAASSLGAEARDATTPAAQAS